MSFTIKSVLIAVIFSILLIGDGGRITAQIKKPPPICNYTPPHHYRNFERDWLNNNLAGRGEILFNNGLRTSWRRCNKRKVLIIEEHNMFLAMLSSSLIQNRRWSVVSSDTKNLSSSLITFRSPEWQLEIIIRPHWLWKNRYYLIYRTIKKQ